VGAQKLKGLKTPFKSTQPLAKTTQKPTPNSGHNPRMDLCPKSTRKKMKKNEEFGKNGFSEKKWKKLKNSLMDGRRWVG
jgi:hypothetical protein